LRERDVTAVTKFRFLVQAPQNFLRLSNADVSIVAFLPYDLARLSGEPGSFFGANEFGKS
jgi:hypothetical protein